MQLKTLIQYLLPHHLLSRLIGKLAKSRCVWLKNLLIDAFIKHYKIDMTSAVEPNPHKYPTFNSLFTRALRAEARPIDNDVQVIISPVDSHISQFGIINDRQLIQAKGVTFDLSTLLSDKLSIYADKLVNGDFITLYLSPSDYHRVHMPLDGKLLAMAHIPGKLFSVNRFSVNNIPQLFVRNERVAMIFETKLGPMAIVMVGAMLVASINILWEQGTLIPAKTINFWNYTQQSLIFKRGAEIGQFQFGSTVILILPQKSLKWSDELRVDSPVKMGERIAVTIF